MQLRYAQNYSKILETTLFRVVRNGSKVDFEVWPHEQSSKTTLSYHLKRMRQLIWIELEYHGHRADVRVLEMM